MSAETSSKFGKIHKKAKLAFGRSKNSKDNVEALDSKKKGFQRKKKSQFYVNDVDDVSFDNRTLNRGGRNMKLKTKDKHIHKGQKVYDKKVYVNSGFKQLDSDTKRKRIYADKEDGKMGMSKKALEAPKKRLSRAVQNELKDDVVKGKRSAGGNSSDFDQPKKRWTNSRANEFLGNNVGKKLRGKVKATDKVESLKTDDAGNSLLKKDVKRKLDQNLYRKTSESVKKSANRKLQDKKNLDDELVERDHQRKKKKRVIRIDPHDISNKRLDDGIITNENTEKNNEDLKKNENIEMSKNAQFRAIQPSPSILSFVEENLLGRRRLIDIRRAGYNVELSAPLDNVPSSTSSERERIEESIFRNKLSFFAAAKISSSFPPPDLPEIAFAGRSNVGKSSLLNALTRQWGVVRTSDKPGLTQTINFFDLGSKLCLVDLPGYGFAYAKEEVKESWEELVKEYVSTRVGLKQVCLLIDTKWGMKPRDHELIDLMERFKTKYQIVLTKTDLVFPIDVARRAMQIEESLKAKKSAIQPLMMISSKSGAGIRSLRTVLSKIARFAKL